MRHNQLLATIITAAAGLLANTACLAQCVNMTDLDDPGTTCYVYNHEFKYRQYYAPYMGVDVYDWVEYANVIEDYGLSNTNNFSYNVPNVQCTRHTIVTEQGPDYIQPALKMIPEGRSSSIRIGNPRNGGKGTYMRQPSQFMKWHPQGEAITMDYKVTADNAILLFEYAAILDRTQHVNDGTDNEIQAFIDVEITDQSGNKLDPSSLAFTCRGGRSVAQDADQGWKSFTHGGIQSSWKDWSKVGFDLTRHIGKTVRLRVANFDCAVDVSNQSSYEEMEFYYCGKHFSYIYFYVDCTQKNIDVECIGNSQARLTVPEGFQYRWYNKAKPNTTLGTSRTIEVPSDGKTTYCCEVTQKERMTGSFTLEATPLCGKEVNIKATICENELPYLFDGKKLTESGNYTQKITLAPGIDSVTNLDLKVQRVTDMPVQTEYICTGSTYKWKVGKKTRTLSKSGTYRDTLRYKSGCDSIRYTLVLNEKDKIETEDHRQVCESMLNGGASGFMWNGKFINKKQDDRLTFTTSSVVSGCDSVVTLVFDYIDDTEFYDTVIVTESEIRNGFDWNGYSIYYDDSSFKSYAEAEAKYNTPAYKKDNYTDLGCPAPIYLRLFIVKEVTESLSLCEADLPMEWRGYTIESAADNGKVFTDEKNRVRYTLNLAVHPAETVDINLVLCDGEEYQFGDTLLTSTGDYTRKFTSQYGCDSTVTVHLTVQKAKNVRTERVTICKGQPAFNWDGHGPEFQNLSEEGFYYDTTFYATGCPKECYTLRISVGDSTIAHLDRRICHGDSINFFGEWIKKSGTYRGVTENSVQCDSIIYMHLEVMPPLQEVVADTVICNGKPFEWRGQTVDRDGQYKDTLVSELECDSVAYILNARFMKSSSADIDTTLCFGETLTIGEVVYEKEGDYTQTIENKAGCDSVVTLHLHYLPEPHRIEAFICEGASYTFHGTDYKKTGQYYFPLGKTRHCEAVDTLDLTVGSVVSGDAYITICAGETYPFGDKVLTESGDYERLIKREGEGLCDSLARVHLTVQSYSSNLDTTVCYGESVTIGGESFSATGTYVNTYQSTMGCDSVITLNLTVLPHPQRMTAFICEGSKYTFHGTDYDTEGQYYFTLGKTDYCEAIDTLDLKVGSMVSGDTYKTLCYGDTYQLGDKVLSSTGDYELLIQRKDEGLCDSLARVHLTVLPPAEYFEENDTIYQGDTLQWRDTLITTGGDFTQRIASQPGCDSLVYTLHAAFREITVLTIDTVIEPGDSYRLNDTTLLTESGTYYDTLYYRNGRDSAYVIIHLEVTQLDVRGTFHIDTVCGNDLALTAVFVREQGHPVSYDLLFSEAARRQGFEDMNSQPMPDTAVALLPVPMPRKADDTLWYVRPDRYEATLRLTDRQDRKTEYNASFTVLYPSWVILQRWNDVLTITNREFNGGYDFTHVQWYVDGEKADGRGGNNFFYYAGDNSRLRTGTPYRAELTRADDGKTFSTCEYMPVLMEEKVVFKKDGGVSISPRYAGDTRRVAVHTTLSGKYIVYDVSGKQVTSGRFGPAYGTPDIVLPASCPNGTYLIRFLPDEAKQTHKKWLVY